MTQLNCNFTNQEQSKRLLELGVPAWTADCYYKESGKIEIKNTALDTLYPSCWSVGRLIEIYEICTQRKFYRKNQTDNLVYLSPLEDVMMKIEYNVCGIFDNAKWDINLLNNLNW